MTGKEEYYSIEVDIDRELKEFGVVNKLNDYIGVQKQILKQLDKEKFFCEVQNEDSGMFIEITRKGIKETLGSGKRFQTLPRIIKELKIATIHSLPEIVKKGKLIINDVKNIHMQSGEFSYFEIDVQINRVPCVITVDAKKTSAKNKFWIHYIRIEKKNSELLTSAKRQKINETQNSSKNENSII